MQELWGLSLADDHLRLNLHAVQCSSGGYFAAVTISAVILTGKMRVHPSQSCSCDLPPCHLPIIF